MRREEISALAVDAFEKGERVRMMEYANTSTEYEERKKAAVAFAIAKAEYAESCEKLDSAIEGKNK